MSGQRKQRSIDVRIKQSYQNLNKLNLVSRFFIRKWKIMLVVLFVVGFITALVWMVSDEYFPW